ncbi:MAG: FtsW/RodA/SpoVE family cell cycle protein [Chloroflexota bacterium]
MSRAAALADSLRLTAPAVVIVACGSALIAASRDGLLVSRWWWTVFAAAIVVAAGVVAVSRPAGDRLVIPIAATLAALGAVTIARLEAPLLDNPDVPFDLLARHLAATGAGVLACVAVALFVRPVTLRRYKYTWLALTLLLLALTILFGQEIRGARLWLRIGPVQIQPSELLRITLVAWLAGYLDERRDLIAPDPFAGRFRAPPVPYLAPIAGIGALSVAALVLQNDLGTSLLLFGIALGMVYAATGAAVYVWVGLAGFAGLAALAAQSAPRLGVRVQNWADPWRDPLASGYQQAQSDYALSAGGVFGTGLGNGMPGAIPDVHTDFVLSAIGEELGLVGTVAILLLLLLFAWRGLAIGLAAPDGFERLLAVGLASGIALQGLLIAGGVIRLIPLTGLTLPFVSFGGSSSVANWIIAGLLVSVSRTAGQRRPGPSVAARGALPYTPGRSQHAGGWPT